ncbi:MAG: hypothetical protein Q8K98_11930 [Bacteroidota bacterium]|nr:hypothetical protein [Bacteroidota bacterium]
MKHIIIVLFLFSFAIISCDHGLAPPPKEKIEQGISGTIYYRGAFPDSLKEHRLFAAKMDRKFRSMNEIMTLILSGSDSIQIYPSILQSPLSLTKEDSIKFRFVLPPALYKYLAVAQTTGAIFDSSQWKIVGVYSLDSINWVPRPILIGSGEFVDSINITVDYNNPPPQPFGIAGRGR